MVVESPGVPCALGFPFLAEGGPLTNSIQAILFVGRGLPPKEASSSRVLIGTQTCPRPVTILPRCQISGFKRRDQQEGSGGVGDVTCSFYSRLRAVGSAWSCL